MSSSYRILTNACDTVPSECFSSESSHTSRSNHLEIAIKQEFSTFKLSLRLESELVPHA